MTVMTDFVVTREIVPDHDCVLVVGPERVRIPANSLFFSAASAPFRAMLGPQWREGSDLRDRSNLFQIPLPEDDPIALQIICAVLHHQNDKIPSELPTYTVLRVAVTADEYDMTLALKFASESWLHSTRDNMDDFFVLAVAAYLFGNAMAFRKITRKMILTHNGPFTAISGTPVEAVMDWRFYGLLEEARSIARLGVASILMNGFNDPTGTCVHKCGWSGRNAFAYLNMLQAQNLWPTDLSGQSIADAIAKAATIPDPIPGEAEPSCTYDYKHSSPEYRKHRQWVLKSLDSRVGLCLHCMKSKSGNASHCQLLHSDVND